MFVQNSLQLYAIPHALRDLVQGFLQKSFLELRQWSSAILQPPEQKNRYLNAPSVGNSLVASAAAVRHIACFF